MQEYNVHTKLHHLICDTIGRVLTEPEKNIALLEDAKIIDFILEVEEKCTTARALKKELYSQG